MFDDAILDPTVHTEGEDAFWRALANPWRRRLLDLLRDGPRTTGDLAERLPEVSRYAVMQHLGVLTDAGLVVVERRGRQRFNHVNAAALCTPTTSRASSPRWGSIWRGRGRWRTDERSRRRGS